MKIDREGSMCFKDIKPGDVFEYNWIIYIKAYNPYNMETFALALDDGSIRINLDDDATVKVYPNAKAVLE